MIIDAGVKIPADLEVGADPELDALRFRRTARGVCLITQPMIDRLDTASRPECAACMSSRSRRRSFR